MKKNVTVAFSILMLCGLLLLNTVRVQASEPGYDIMEAYSAGGVVLDGEMGADEWNPSTVWIEYLDPYDARFGYKMAGMAPYYMAWIIEFPDNTNDTDDVWQICIDGTPADEGTAPTTNCHKIEITGHETLTVYIGNGSDWVEMDGADVQWAESLTTTSDWAPYNEEHYVVEIIADKGTLGAWGANPPPNGLRVAMYDASNDSQGWIAWPPNSDPDVPDSWGRIATYGETVPEGLSFGVVVLLSSAAVAVGFYCLRKRAKTQSYSAAKTGINTL